MVVFLILALDADSISKGKTVYKLVGINPPIVGNRSFTVSPDGKIRTERKFNRELQSRYVLTLHAEDHTSLSGKIRRTTFCVIVHIKDANDHKPRFVAMLCLLTFNFGGGGRGEIISFDEVDYLALYFT